MKSCEKIGNRPRQGPKQVAGGKRKARIPRLAGTGEGSPGATEVLLWQSFLSPLPGLAALNTNKPRAALRGALFVFSQLLTPGEVRTMRFLVKYDRDRADMDSVTF